MAITTLDQYIASGKQRAEIFKTATRTTVAAVPFSVIDLAGSPQGSLTATVNPSTLVVGSDTGFPNINFSSGDTYLSRVEFYNSVTSRLMLVDMLYRARCAAAYTAQTFTMSSQPSISGRVTDYTGGASFGNGTELWMEVATAFAGGTSLTVTITYTNSEGVTGRSTGAISFALAALTLGKMQLFPLQSGDYGVQKIESVVIGSVSGTFTAGALNACIVRPLWTMGRVQVANGGDTHDLLKTGMPQIFNTTALFPIVQADSTVSGLIDISVELCNG